jgi:hypothetical protein
VLRRVVPAAALVAAAIVGTLAWRARYRR